MSFISNIESPLHKRFKQPRDKRNYAFNFAGIPEISDNGESITECLILEVTPTSPEPLVLPLASAVTIVDKDADGKNEFVAFRIEGGKAGVTYKISIVVKTNQNNEIEADGLLEVID